MEISYHKTPRLYYPQELKTDQMVRLVGNAHHYLRNVMRKEEGDIIRLFNAEHGEFSGVLFKLHKKYIDVQIKDQLRLPHNAKMDHPRITLACPILPKDRMDMLIEKSVELGAHAIQPLLFNHSSVRKLKEERIEAQIIEASEQCERLDIPKLSKIASFDTILRQHDTNTPLVIALERSDSKPIWNALHDAKKAESIIYVIGPEGGFSEKERALIERTDAQAVTLGDNILRAETAAFYGLSVISALSHQT
jgi:16S rRNA (uracil1498-N3)-methyltransferase